MSLNDAIFKTLEEVEGILSLQEIYDYIVEKGYYTWSGNTARTALNSIGRTLNEASKTDANIVKIANSKIVLYYNKVHESNLDVEKKIQELATQDKFISLTFATAGCVELLMSVLEFNTEGNRKGFPDPKPFNFYASEMKSTNLIYTNLKKIQKGDKLVSQYMNHLTKLELLDTQGNLTQEGKYIVDNYSEADFTSDSKKMELDSYIFNFLLEKVKNGSFINKKARDYVPDKFVNTVNVYNAIPKEIRDDLLSDFSPENLDEVLFLQRIYFHGNEISRYFRLDEEEREALKECWNTTKASIPVNKPADKPQNLSSIENTIFDYIIVDKSNKMQADVRYRSWANLKAYDDLIKENPDNKLNFLNNEIVVDVEVDNKQEMKSNSESVNSNKIEYDFELQNILFKGVPGTGKSHIIDEIIKNKLHLEKKPENVLRINIHSASSNADLMQGIAISSEENKVSYQEKQGLIFEHIKHACYHPNEPYVLVLEEIQENSLNELIGDLIYLIEPKKRAKIQTLDEADFDQDTYEYQDLIDFYIKKLEEKMTAEGDEDNKVYRVEIPNLVSIGDKRKLIMPDNLFVFCTSNYRDDKKVIEDNLLRRFDVIEVYPQYKQGYVEPKVAEFLDILNERIFRTFKAQHETHPDRFVIGHANWLKVSSLDSKEFFKALLKVVIEFKEIREIDYKTIEPIFSDQEIIKYISDCDITDYKTFVQSLQCKVYDDLFTCEQVKEEENSNEESVEEPDRQEL